MPLKFFTLLLKCYMNSTHNHKFTTKRSQLCFIMTFLTLAQTG